MHKLLVLVLCAITLFSIGVSVQAEVINGSFEQPGSTFYSPGWTGSWTTDWILVYPGSNYTISPIDGDNVMMAYTHSYMTGPDWLVNQGNFVAGVYDVSFYAVRRAPGGTINVFAGIGNTTTTFNLSNYEPLPGTGGWEYFQTRIYTEGGPLKFGIFTTLDLVTYIDNFVVTPVPEPMSLLCLGTGLIASVGMLRRRCVS